MNEKIIAKIEESEEQKNARFADGQISEEEIKEYWENPDTPIFEHTVKKRKGEKEQKTKFKVQVLSESLKDDLLAELGNSWDKPTFEELKGTLELFFEQKKIGHPALLNVEYYVAVDSENNPFAITGIYTDDIYGGAGFATRDKLDSQDHYLATRLGWFSVSEKYQESGVGGFLFDWIEKIAKNRGSKVMVAETDDWENEKAALNLYASRGYKQGLDIKDYFGPGRDMVNYFAKVEGVQPFIIEEKVTAENKAKLLDLGKKIYSAERYKEFEVCLGLFLQQREGEETIIAPHSFVLRDPGGGIESFSILFSGIYENAIFSAWEGANPEINDSKEKLAEALKGYALSQDKGIILVTREGEDEEFLRSGFKSGNDGVPEVFEKGDPTKFLLYSKRL